MEFLNLLWTELSRESGLILSESQDALLNRYLDLLSEANKKMNLTRITDRAAAEVQHIGDSLTLLPYLPRESHQLADVGSGGGVPGLPLAILRPDVSITLIESTKKKAVFLRETIASLALSNVTVLDSRAEDVGRGKLRETFNVAVVRAVATLDWLAEWCLPLVRKGGKVLAMKGERAADELPAAATAIRLMGGGPAVVHPVVLPGSEHRVIVEIPKQGKSHNSFPRSATEAKGKPIGRNRV
jgi:16S rRNA (guanine527-N7)-methyltransferase